MVFAETDLWGQLFMQEKKKKKQDRAKYLHVKATQTANKVKIKSLRQ